MSQVETLPQSIADIRIIILKPRLDHGDIQLIGEKIKPRLFTRFGFGAKPGNVQLLCCESYFEPYLFIGGKYTLDYCRKHVFEVKVTESLTKVFIAGQEFRSEQSDPKVTNKVIKMTGEERAHCERQAYFVLDRMKREVSPEKLPLSPFDIQQEKPEHSSNFKSIQISDETQIEFLKSKIAKRPSDLAEIIKEVFDITDRAIAYYPMYQLTFENTKNHTDAVVAINGITGEITLNGSKKLAVKTIIAPDEVVRVTQPLEKAVYEKLQVHEKPKVNLPEKKEDVEKTPKEEKTIHSAQPVEKFTSEKQQTESILKTFPAETNETTETPANEETIQPARAEIEETMFLGFPAKIFGQVISVEDNVIAVVGDIEIPSGTEINKTLVVKGALKIGDNCRVRGKIKALRDITVGADTIIDGDLISGGNILVGPRSLVNGSVQASGTFEIEKNAVVEGVCSQTPPSE